MRCHATVLQKGSDFRLCSNAHVHPADPKLSLRAKSSTIRLNWTHPFKTQYLRCRATNLKGKTGTFMVGV
ncbi:hypothetical protein DPMN_029129 [Dreissena polymorpha]|uniref:Uncharacterized protein n=1 Tax=Dreissena polymorpha TaxID=45954 RepID=A0A9D4LVX2_DREPO|nr:hypothetical protein DPMN_029129 [Dreissena polymorpha]